MREFIERLLNEYVNVKKEKLDSNPFAAYITNQVPDEIYDTGIVNPEYYLVKGSVGQGNWVEVPWVSIFDKAITTSATYGVYIVYLLSNDGSSLYLTLNQGCTELMGQFDKNKKKESCRVLLKRAEKIAATLNSRNFFKANNESKKTINLGNKVGDLGQLYEAGTILYKEYKRGAVPSEEVLCADLKELVEIYAQYYCGLLPHNRIIYGAPGTGKSHKIENEKKTFLKSNKGNYERVTFHPDYSYANFVGTYKPVPDLDEEGKKTISYKFVPGPFLRIYAKAIAHPEQQFLLLIEEINRAMVAAVFGDVFQLLDRNKSGESEYPITTSEDVRRYLAEALNKDMSEVETIYLPSNLYIWATMNSADQGVFPMDTAFKRRWEFEYIDINSAEEGISDIQVNLPTGSILPDKTCQTIAVNWNSLRRAINSKMIDCGINEDKLLGPYFLSPDSFVDDAKTVDSQKFITVFKNKVIMYLFEDAAKQYRRKIFEGAINRQKKTYSEICKMFDESGLSIFPDDLKNLVITNSNK